MVIWRRHRKSTDHRNSPDEAHVHGKLACTDWGTYLQRTPQVGVSIVSLGNQRHHLSLVSVSILCQGNFRNELTQNVTPLLPCHVSIRIPVFDDIPESKHTEELKACVGKL